MVKVLNKYRDNLVGLDGAVINIMRGSILGNYPGVGLERDKSIEAYRKYLWVEIRKGGKILNELKRILGLSIIGNVYLVCCCKPKPCHGDIVVNAIEWLSNQE